MAVAVTATILNSKQLELLAYVIYHEERNAINSILYIEDSERSELLMNSYYSYNTILKYSKHTESVHESTNDSNNLGNIADQISQYWMYCANAALQTINNFTVRKTFLEKCVEHIDFLVRELHEVDPQKDGDVGHMLGRVNMFCDVMKEYMNMCYNENSYKKFSEQVKGYGWSFADLVKKYQDALGDKYKHPFKDLEDEEKLEVYQKIVHVSGAGTLSIEKKFLKKKLSGASSNGPIEEDDVKGIATLIYATAKLAWDIYSSSHVIPEEVDKAVKNVAGAAGGFLETIIGAILATGALSAIESSTIFIAVLGFVSGIGATIIVVGVAGLVLDKVFNSGGAEPIPEDKRCYVVPKSDGKSLAKVIADPQATP